MGIITRLVTQYVDQSGLQALLIREFGTAFLVKVEHLPSSYAICTINQRARFRETT